MFLDYMLFMQEYVLSKVIDMFSQKRDQGARVTDADCAWCSVVREATIYGRERGEKGLSARAVRKVREV